MEVAEQVDRLREEFKKIKCWLLDMDGTVSFGDRMIPGADKFFERIREKGTNFIFLTNNSSQRGQAYVDRMKNLGIDLNRDQMLTSTDALIMYLKGLHGESSSQFEDTYQQHEDNPHLYDKKSCLHEGSSRPHLRKSIRVFCVGTPDFENEIREAGFTIIKGMRQGIDAVLVGFDTSLVYEKLDIACDYIIRGTPWYAANPDRVCPMGEGRVLPDCGAIISFLETCTGISPKRIIGKPDSTMAKMVMEAYSYEAHELAMVGDRLYTDIQFAINAGIKSIAVLSGETSLEEIEESGLDVNHIFPSLGDMATYI